MRRKDRQITDMTEIEAIIGRCRYCRLGLSHDNRPYIVPMSFGYRSKSVYFHSAGEGLKLDILRKNPVVCVEFDTDCTIKIGEKACNWGFGYQSVIGSGNALFLETPAEKKAALAIIMAQYTTEQFCFSDADIRHVVVFRVDMDEICGKKAPPA
jgi:hypothetical protein